MYLNAVLKGVTVRLMSLFAYMENCNESLDQGAHQPGGPLIFIAALVQMFFHAPPGKGH